MSGKGTTCEGSARRRVPIRRGHGCREMSDAPSGGYVRRGIPGPGVSPGTGCRIRSCGAVRCGTRDGEPVATALRNDPRWSFCELPGVNPMACSPLLRTGRDCRRATRPGPPAAVSGAPTRRGRVGLSGATLVISALGAARSPMTSVNAIRSGVGKDSLRHPPRRRPDPASRVTAYRSTTASPTTRLCCRPAFAPLGCVPRRLRHSRTFAEVSART